MDVALEIAGAADTDLLIKFMREFYELDRLAFEEQSARSALQQILSDDSFGRVWLIQTNRTPIGYVVLTLGFSLEFHGRDASLTRFISPRSIRAVASGGKRSGLSKKLVVRWECRPYTSRLGVEIQMLKRCIAHSALKIASNI